MRATITPFALVLPEIFCQPPSLVLGRAAGDAAAAAVEQLDECNALCTCAPGAVDIIGDAAVCAFGHDNVIESFEQRNGNAVVDPVTIVNGAARSYIGITVRRV